MSEQGDLTHLVAEDEHIRGSMPAGASEREAAANAWYGELRARSKRRPRRPRTSPGEQLSIDDAPQTGESDGR